MKRTKKLLIGFSMCMALAGRISISQGVQAANDDFIIQDEVSSQDSISDSVIQDEALSQNDVDDSVIQDKAASASDFVIENDILWKYTGNGGDVIIPDGVKRIGLDVFKNCISLTNVMIPNSVVDIDFYTFSGCTNLQKINVDEGNPSYSSEDGIVYNKDKTILIFCPKGKTNVSMIPKSVKEINDSAFWKCTSLINISIPDSVTSIGYGAFSECNNLMSIIIADSVTDIKQGAFNGCTSLTTVDIPKSLTKINSGTFSECTSLKNITIPNGVTSIGDYAFLGCTSLTDINIPSSVTSIGPYWSFARCSSLTNIDIPNGVTGIEWGTFSGCTSLTNINIPASVTSIAPYAFEGCISLTNINIPANIKEIDGYAFVSCKNLEITVDEKNPYYSSENGILYDKNKTTLISFPKINSNNFIIPSIVTNIGDYAFTRTEIRKIIFPVTVKEIGYGALFMCPNLEEITILNPKSKLWSDDIYWNIIGKQEPAAGSVSVGTGGSSGTGSSMSNEGLMKNSPILSIRGYKGSTAEKLANHLRENKKDYGYETVKFVALDGTGDNTPKPNKPKTPNKGTILKSKNTTYTVTKKGSKVAFTKISSAAASVSIPNTVKIGGINYKVTSISPNAFKGNKKLSKVTIGENITSIGKNAFSGCKNLKTITIKSTKLKSIGQNAFKGIKSTARIKVPSKRLKAYKKLLKGKGQGKKVKINM